MFEITNTLMGPLESLCTAAFAILVGYCLLSIIAAFGGKKK